MDDVLIIQCKCSLPGWNGPQVIQNVGGWGGGSDKKLILTEGQQGEHHSACYLGIELGFGVVFLPMMCTLPAFFVLFCFVFFCYI